MPLSRVLVAWSASWNFCCKWHATAGVNRVGRCDPPAWKALERLVKSDKIYNRSHIFKLGFHSFPSSYEIASVTHLSALLPAAHSPLNGLPFKGANLIISSPCPKVFEGSSFCVENPKLLIMGLTTFTIQPPLSPFPLCTPCFCSPEFPMFGTRQITYQNTSPRSLPWRDQAPDSLWELHPRDWHLHYCSSKTQGLPLVIAFLKLIIFMCLHSFAPTCFKVP